MSASRYHIEKGNTSNIRTSSDRLTHHSGRIVTSVVSPRGNGGGCRADAVNHVAFIEGSAGVNRDHRITQVERAAVALA